MGLFSFLIQKVSKFATENVTAHGVLPLKLHMSIVLDMTWVHVIHVLGMLGVVRGGI